MQWVRSLISDDKTYTTELNSRPHTNSNIQYFKTANHGRGFAAIAMSGSIIADEMVNVTITANKSNQSGSIFD